ncbi:hypothetical protein D3C77_557900 [compost metagenome]
MNRRGIVLKYGTDLADPICSFLYAFPFKLNDPLVWLLNPEQQSSQCGFTAAAFADNSKAFPAFYFEADIMKNLLPPFGEDSVLFIRLFHPVNGQQRERPPSYD